MSIVVREQKPWPQDFRDWMLVLLGFLLGVALTAFCLTNPHFP